MILHGNYIKLTYSGQSNNTVSRTWKSKVMNILYNHVVIYFSIFLLNDKPALKDILYIYNHIELDFIATFPAL